MYGSKAERINIVVDEEFERNVIRIIFTLKYGFF